jgi:HK97 family phage prohead protease/HK97 family phage major capsid protein
MGAKYDFVGWATRNNILCADGRTIRHGAFSKNNGQKVPLCWNHDHTDIENVLGHAILEEVDDGVRAYGYLNHTKNGDTARELIHSGDIVALSIYANQLKQNGGDVIHGNIREVSLVHAGANPGAYIDTVIEHSDDMDETAYITFVMDDSITHSEEEAVKEAAPVQETKTETAPSAELAHSEEKKEDKQVASERTVGDVVKEFTDEQKKVVEYLIGMALEEAAGKKSNDEGEDENMKHNVFDNDIENKNENVLTHSEMAAIIDDASRFGSLKESALQHGITDIDYLFPDAKNLDTPPQFIKRDTGWVSKVMGSVHHTPFSRIKSMFADITADEARAKGYIKGNQKTDEVFTLLKRTTGPTTVYKKQSFHRDDLLDITDFDVVAWVKAEMRMMLEEEIARAILIGDGRSTASDDKIDESNIRPVWTDADLYTVKVPVTVSAQMTDDQKAKAIIRSVIKSRKNYKGSGNPVFYTTEDVLTDMLLIEDGMGRVIYDTIEKLKTALRVSDIVTVEVMESQTREVSGVTRTLAGIIVNLTDYNVGADKGGAVSMFDDFDIDYNKQKYLIETRCSGALTKPYSAMAIELVPASQSNDNSESDGE